MSIRKRISVPKMSFITAILFLHSVHSSRMTSGSVAQPEPRRMPQADLIDFEAMFPTTVPTAGESATPASMQDESATSSSMQDQSGKQGDIQPVNTRQLNSIGISRGEIAEDGRSNSSMGLQHPQIATQVGSAQGEKPTMSLIHPFPGPINEVNPSAKVDLVNHVDSTALSLDDMMGLSSGYQQRTKPHQPQSSLLDIDAAPLPPSPEDEVWVGDAVMDEGSTPHTPTTGDTLFPSKQRFTAIEGVIPANRRSSGTRFLADDLLDISNTSLANTGLQTRNVVLRPSPRDAKNRTTNQPIRPHAGSIQDDLLMAPDLPTQVSSTLQQKVVAPQRIAVHPAENPSAEQPRDLLSDMPVHVSVQSGAFSSVESLDHPNAVHSLKTCSEFVDTSPRTFEQYEQHAFSGHGTGVGNVSFAQPVARTDAYGDRALSYDSFGRLDSLESTGKQRRDSLDPRRESVDSTESRSSSAGRTQRKKVGGDESMHEQKVGYQHRNRPSSSSSDQSSEEIEKSAAQEDKPEVLPPGVATRRLRISSHDDDPRLMDVDEQAHARDQYERESKSDNLVSSGDARTEIETLHRSGKALTLDQVAKFWSESKFSKSERKNRGKNDGKKEKDEKPDEEIYTMALIRSLQEFVPTPDEAVSIIRKAVREDGIIETYQAALGEIALKIVPGLMRGNHPLATIVPIHIGGYSNELPFVDAPQKAYSFEQPVKDYYDTEGDAADEYNYFASEPGPNGPGFHSPLKGEDSIPDNRRHAYAYGEYNKCRLQTVSFAPNFLHNRVIRHHLSVFAYEKAKSSVNEFGRSNFVNKKNKLRPDSRGEATLDNRWFGKTKSLSLQQKEAIEDQLRSDAIKNLALQQILVKEKQARGQQPKDQLGELPKHTRPFAEQLKIENAKYMERERTVQNDPQTVSERIAAMDYLENLSILPAATLGEYTALILVIVWWDWVRNFVIASARESLKFLDQENENKETAKSSWLNTLFTASSAKPVRDTTIGHDSSVFLSPITEDGYPASIRKTLMSLDIMRRPGGATLLEVQRANNDKKAREYLFNFVWNSDLSRSGYKVSEVSGEVEGGSDGVRQGASDEMEVDQQHDVASDSQAEFQHAAAGLDKKSSFDVNKFENRVVALDDFIENMFRKDGNGGMDTGATGSLTEYLGLETDYLDQEAAERSASLERQIALDREASMRSLQNTTSGLSVDALPTQVIMEAAMNFPNTSNLTIRAFFKQQKDIIEKRIHEHTEQQGHHLQSGQHIQSGQDRQSDGQGGIGGSALVVGVGSTEIGRYPRLVTEEEDETMMVSVMLQEKTSKRVNSEWMGSHSELAWHGVGWFVDNPTSGELKHAIRTTRYWYGTHPDRPAIVIKALLKVMLGRLRMELGKLLLEPEREAKEKSKRGGSGPTIKRANTEADPSCTTNRGVLSSSVSDEEMVVVASEARIMGSKEHGSGSRSSSLRSNPREDYHYYPRHFEKRYNVTHCKEGGRESGLSGASTGFGDSSRFENGVRFVTSSRFAEEFCEDTFDMDDMRDPPSGCGFTGFANILTADGCSGQKGTGLSKKSLIPSTVAAALSEHSSGSQEDIIPVINTADNSLLLEVVFEAIKLANSITPLDSQLEAEKANEGTVQQSESNAIKRHKKKKNTENKFHIRLRKEAVDGIDTRLETYVGTEKEPVNSNISYKRGGLEASHVSNYLKRCGVVSREHYEKISKGTSIVGNFISSFFDAPDTTGIEGPKPKPAFSIWDSP